VSAYEVRRIEDLEEIPIEGAGINWRPIRRPLDIRAFGINAYTGDEGKHVVEEHTEKMLGHEEVYVVLAGRASFTLGDVEVEVAAGSFVFVRDPGTKRGAVALENGTTVLAVGGKPGEAYEPSAWESWFAASPFRQRGEYDKALAVIVKDLKQRPEHPALLYETACYEALLGRRDDALAHLREAVEREPRFAASAAKDEDFASLAEDRSFLAITGQAKPGGGGA
jgi:mannose-6-phosphate isomerase-like protein (cupin superfamily)